MQELILSVAISTGTATLLGPYVIPKLRQLKFGQSIREEGPQSHQVKAGTPTMGGILIIMGFLSTMLFLQRFSLQSLAVTAGLLLFGSVGFIDDYIKVVLKRNLGLRAYQKIIGQTAIGIFVGYLGYLNGPDMLVPFTKLTLHLGIWFIPVMLVVFLAVTNAVNLTDGLDGLASGTTIFSALFFAAAAVKMGQGDVAVASLALAGGCLGFLFFNKYPAKVFMGDAGSLAIGGALGAIAMILKLPLFLPFVGLVFVLETLSVIIQVTSFKLTGKRVFKMSPIHHHFELSGWKETKVVRVFWTTAFLAAVVAWVILSLSI